MTEILLIVVVVLQFAILFRKVQIDLSPVQQAFQAAETAHERAVRDEIAKNREESSNAARQSWEEVADTLKAVGDSLTEHLRTQAQANDSKLADVQGTVEKQLAALLESNASKMNEMRRETAASAQEAREALANTLKGVTDSLNKQLVTLSEANDQKLGAVKDTVKKWLGTLQEEHSKQLDQIRLESTAAAQKTREEVAKAISDFMVAQQRQSSLIVEQLRTLARSSENQEQHTEETLKAQNERHATAVKTTLPIQGQRQGDGRPAEKETHHEREKRARAWADNAGATLHVDEDRPERPVVGVDLLPHAAINDADLEQLTTLPDLRWVGLSDDTQITDRGKSRLKSLKVALIRPEGESNAGRNVRLIGGATRGQKGSVIKGPYRLLGGTSAPYWLIKLNYVLPTYIHFVRSEFEFVAELIRLRKPEAEARRELERIDNDVLHNFLKRRWHVDEGDFISAQCACALYCIATKDRTVRKWFDEWLQSDIDVCFEAFDKRVGEDQAKRWREDLDDIENLLKERLGHCQHSEPRAGMGEGYSEICHDDAAPVPAAVSEGYVASKTSATFHRAGCEGAGKIAERNLRRYATREEAVLAGKKPCHECNP